ncbi:MAG: integrase arm-type DNA-binding domain-containing protein [Burkholderiaceae bacterium]
MASQNLLSDKTIKAAVSKAIASGQRSTLSDGAGMTLQVQPSGAGWWRLRYWIGGRENRLSLGTYPAVSLKAAREKRDEARGLIAAGSDPSEHRKAGKADRAARKLAAKLQADGKPLPGTFEAVARDWLTRVHVPKVSANHADRTRRRLEQDVFPFLGARPVGEIEPPELLACLRRVEDRGAIETTHRIKDACGQVFRYAIAAGLAKRNPAADLRDALKPVPVRHLAAIVDPAQGGQLLRDIADYQGHPVTLAALRLSPLLLLRPGELRHLEWVWIDEDEAMLTVPASLMKRTKEQKANGVPHLVPLAPQALAILAELHPLTGRGRYLFPSLLTGERCMSENTVRAALRRLGYSNDEMTAHGFRAMARTMIAERLGIEPEVIEAQLAHAVPDALGRAYNRTQFLEQRRKMMAAWADYLDGLRDGAQVLPINTGTRG